MIIGTIVITVLFVIFLPIGLAIALRRRFSVPWWYFMVGIFTFIGAQVVHLPLNHLLSQMGILPEGARSGGELILMAMILGLTAGVTEELARAVGFGLAKQARRFEDGVMMGLGHGGIEAMILGVLIIASAVSLNLLRESGSLPSDLTPEQKLAVERQLELFASTPFLALAPVVERIIALILQVSLSIVVLQAFIRRNWLYVLIAILIHAGFDFVAVYASVQLENIWLIEALLFALAAPLAFWAWQFRPRGYPGDGQHGLPPSMDLGLFSAALRKEILYQWRTKRVLIVCAVFLVFGMISPLLAKYTPELLGSIEGAEQFADLIPEPTINDAMGQYIKNITQFGFILAILLGMGAIAGEKERGTATMVMSKPLARWAFVLSKFISQAAVYSLAFILAAVAAYTYTMILFGSIDWLKFIAVNILLLTWLLVFASVTLLGSTIGKTTAAAAGIGLLGSVLLLLAGAIPQISGLTPSGLVSWAGQLAIGENIPPNAGALAMSLVIMLVTLIASVAVFEGQEV